MTPECANRHEPDDRVQLFPTIGYPISGGNVWRVLVQGRVAQQAPVKFGQRLMLKGLIRALDLPASVAQGDLFSERVRGFLLSPVAGQRVQIELADQRYVLRRKSKGSGLISCKVDLPERQLEGFRRFGESLTLPRPKACREARWETNSCPVLLAEPKGVSVISDIDDTIKLTEVTSRRRMLHRTFALPFESIEGMADIYARWSQQGALFHYVSSSPWQIYRPIQDFLCEFSFPIGSVHLKWFRLRDEIFKRWRIRKKGKSSVIRNLVKRMPTRSFVLIGDSGEKDPEIYAKVASKHPKQVLRICIRQIEANPLDNDRLQRIYRRYGLTVQIQVFSHAAQLGDLL
jgi:phosphatidate phosphatase APP1